MARLRYWLLAKDRLRHASARPPGGWVGHLLDWVGDGGHAARADRPPAGLRLALGRPSAASGWRAARARLAFGLRSAGLRPALGLLATG